MPAPAANNTVNAVQKGPKENKKASMQDSHTRPQRERERERERYTHTHARTHTHICTHTHAHVTGLPPPMVQLT